MKKIIFIPFIILSFIGCSGDLTIKQSTNNGNSSSSNNGSVQLPTESIIDISSGSVASDTPAPENASLYTISSHIPQTPTYDTTTVNYSLTGIYNSPNVSMKAFIENNAVNKNINNDNDTMRYIIKQQIDFNNTAKATVRYATITASTSVQAGNFNSIEDTYGSMEVYNSTLIRTSTTSGKSAISTHDKITTPSAAYTDQLTLYDCTHDNPDMGGFVVEARKDSTGYWAKVYNVKPYTNYQVKFTTTIGSYTKSVIGDDSQDDWQTRINKSDYGNRTGTYKTSIAVINKSTGATTLTLPTLTVDL